MSLPSGRDVINGRSPVNDNTGTTMRLDIEDSAFLLERLAADCAPLQEFRELTRNALEAIDRVGGDGGVVAWDADWVALGSQIEQGQPLVYKLSVYDTGDGMSGQEMLRYINHLSASSGVQALNANFGVGAKITAGVNNPTGLVYTSLKDGKVHQIHFWRDPETGEYGVRPFENRHGAFDHVRRLKTDVLPPAIVEAGHGTVVTLLGAERDANTMLPPPEATGGLRWLVRYLNRRFLRFPDGVKVSIREFSRSEVGDWPVQPTTYAKDGSIIREARGQEHFLDKNAAAKGAVRLEAGKATAHWWLLTDEKKISDSSYWLSTGHVAALFQDELYELRDGNAGTRQLMHFGVLFGTRRVVIYVEPDQEAELSPNTARSQLLLGGEPLPWEAWGTEFRRPELFPAEIRDMMDELLGQSSEDSGEDAIRDRIRRVQELMRVPRYRRSATGSVNTAGDALGGESGSAETGKSTRTNKSGTDGGRMADLYGAYVDEDEDDPADEIDAKVRFPEIRWVSIAKGTREDGDILEDRAASYVNSTQNVLKINEDFRVYTDLVKHFMRQYEGVPGVEQTVPAVVKEWYSQQLVEAVLGVLYIRGSARWTPAQVEEALSEEALTAVVMPRYHVFNAVLRALGTKLGSRKDRPAPDASAVAA